MEHIPSSFLNKKGRVGGTFLETRLMRSFFSRPLAGSNILVGNHFVL